MGWLEGWQARQEARGRGARGAFALLEDRSLQARVAFLSVGLGLVNSFLILVVALVFDEPVTAAVVGAMMLVSIAVLAASSRTGWSAVAPWNYAGLLAGTVTVHVLLGGFLWSGGALLWGVHAAVNAALMQDRRRTVGLVLGGFVGAALLLAPLEEVLRSQREQPALALSVFVMVDFLVFTCLVVVVPPILALVSRLRVEQRRNRELMLNVLPESVADRLKSTEEVVADEYPSCSVLFADLVGFTAHARELAPRDLVSELNVVFSAFDEIVAAHGAEKIKTIGDGYMVACGLPDADPRHAATACSVALGLQQALPGLNDQLATAFQLRVGISTGPAVAGVIGTAKFAYDVWGDTVNQASRLESTTEPGTIAVSRAVVDGAGDGFRSVPRGERHLKGQGLTPVWELEGRAAVSV